MEIFGVEIEQQTVAAMIAAFIAAAVAIYVLRRQERGADRRHKETTAPKLDLATRDDWPVHDNLPAEHRAIVGREDELARLAAMVKDAPIAAVTGERANMATLKGPGGIGKTALATEFARINRQAFEGVWVVPAESDETMFPSLATLGKKLECPDQTDAKETALDALRAVRDRPHPWLLVFDNAKDHASIAEYLIGGPNARVLITSRSTVWNNVPDFTVGLLDADEAIRLLKQTCKRDDLDFTPLVERLEGYPLALVAAGGFFFEDRNATVAGYLDKFDARMREAIADGSYKPTEDKETYPPSIFGSLSLSIDRLDDDARDLLSLCAYLSPDDLWKELIERGSKEDQDLGKHPWPDFVERIKQDKDRLDAAFKTLTRASLIRAEGETHTIHRLTQEVMRARLGEDGARWADAAARTVNILTPYDSDEPTHWAISARLAPHAAALLDHAPPSQAADRMFSQLGVYYQARGDYAASIQFKKRSVEISAEVNGADSAPHALNLNNLASAHEHAGELDAAEPQYKGAIHIDEAVLGEHPQTATHINNLAGLYWRRKAFAEAEPLFLRAEAIDRAALVD